METKTRGLKESGPINYGSVHGQNQYRVWHVISVWFRTGQDRSKSWAAQIQAGTSQDQGQAQYKAGQVERTTDTVESDPSKGTMQAYIQLRDAKKKHPEVKTRGRYRTTERSGGTSANPGHHP